MGEKPVSSVGTAEYDQLLVVLREARKRANMTQRALSLALGKSVTYIDKIERGVRRLDVIEFCQIATQLGLDPRQLLNQLLADINDQGCLKADPFHVSTNG